MKPLVFVPGFPGSTLLDPAAGRKLYPNLSGLLSPTIKPLILARLAGPEDPDRPDGVVAGEPVRSLLRFQTPVDLSGIVKQAESLYEILRALGYRDAPDGDDMRALGWDWRLPVDHGPTLDALQGVIDDLHVRSGRRVTVLVHSTGGLVLRSLLEARPAVADRLERVIAFGVPWAGTLASFGALLGETPFPLLSTAETAAVVRRAWAAYDLLPPDPAKAEEVPTLFSVLDTATGRLVPSSPLVDHRWMPAAPAHLVTAMRARARRSDERLGRRRRSLQLGGRRLAVVNIVGFGIETATGYHLVPGVGGVRLQKITTDEGDGTIPRRSAAWLRGDVTTLSVPLGHTSHDQITRPHRLLWQTQAGRELLGGLLADRAMEEHAWAAVDGSTATSAGPDVLVRFAVFDRNGSSRPGAFATARGLIGGNGQRVALGDDGIGSMRIPRQLMRAVDGTGLLRFEIGLHWTGRAQPDREHPLVVART